MLDLGQTGFSLQFKAVIIMLVLLFDWFVLQSYRWLPTLGEHFYKTFKEKMEYRRKLHFMATIIAGIIAFIVF